MTPAHPAARDGAWAGPRVVFGHALVEAPLVIALALGLGVALQNETVLGVVALVGAVVLIALALLTLRETPTLSSPLAVSDASARLSGARTAIAAGVVLSASNPYFLLWWGSVGAGLIGQSLAYGLIGLSVFYLGHILSDIAWYSLVAVAVARGAQWMSRRVYQAMMVALSGAMIVLGVGFASAAIDRLFR
ncbi:MAG: LysE family translocator [Dehalococcoidia bacterium]|nr:LysE family translocator [Dehalococcoidia bacterium]